MQTRTLALWAALALAPGAALAQSAETDPQAFAEMAASSDMFEIQSSELALEVSQDAEIRAFAEQMIADHTQASAQLTAAAEIDGVTLPTSMLDKHQVELDRLQEAGEDGFDAAYLAAQAIGHEEAVTLFEAFAAEGEESALRDFAAETLPTLQQHQTDVEGLEET